MWSIDVQVVSYVRPCMRYLQSHITLVPQLMEYQIELFRHGLHHLLHYWVAEVEATFPTLTCFLDAGLPFVAEFSKLGTVYVHKFCDHEGGEYQLYHGFNAKVYVGYILTVKVQDGWRKS